MPLENRLKIQIFVQGLHPKLNQRLPVAAKEQHPVAQHRVAQRRRGLVEDQHIHVVGVQQFHQTADDLEPHIQATVIVGVTFEQHGDVHIAERPGLSPSVRAEQISQYHLIQGGEISSQYIRMPTEVKMLHNHIFAICNLQICEKYNTAPWGKQAVKR